MLTLHHAWASTCSQKVRLCLAEKRLPYDGQVLNLRRFEQLSPSFLALNPDGMVPVLIHDGFVVRESTVINDYLDEAFPEPPLRPVDPIGRARVGMWRRFIDEVPTHAIKAPSFHRNLRPALAAMPADELEAALARMPDPAVAARWRAAARAGIASDDLATAHAKLRRTLARIDDALRDAPWLAGAACTLADIDMLPFVHRLASFDEYDLTRDWPRVQRWYDAMRARPSFDAAGIVEQSASLDPPAPSTSVAAQPVTRDDARLDTSSRGAASDD